MRDRWSGLELRYLVTLAEVGRQASFSKAADALGYTQSAVSQQISRLEHVAGTRLVERPGGPRPVSLTPAGQLLAGHAGAIAARLASAAADLDALASGTAGLLRIGCYQSVGARLLPPVMREFAAAWPQVEVRLSETQDDGDLLADLEGGRLDLTFVVFPLTPGPFEAVELLEDPYVLAVPADSELGRRPSPVSPRHLAGMPLITYAQMREVHSIENRLGRPRLRDQIVFRSHDNATIMGLAAAGVGAAILSWLSADPHHPGLCFKRLAKVSPRIVGIAWHRDRYRIPAAGAFIRLTQRAAEREQQAAQLLDQQSRPPGIPPPGSRVEQQDERGT
jgi:DNA-binding transcriptional LysR family regulator